MKAEFKEKTFEKQFGHELAQLAEVTFSPDQCDEHLLGFDEAFLLPLDHLILVGPFVRRARWARRTGIPLGILDELDDEVVQRLPPFRFNLFVQYKRPEYLRSRGAKQWSHWHSAYFRFETTSHQQDRLEKIEDESHGRAATVYAAPAFWRSTELWTHIRNHQVVANSNIPSAGRLRGHNCYTYSGPGQFGIGHSEPKRIESPPLSDTIAFGLDRNDPVDAKTHIIETAKLVASVLERDDVSRGLFDQARASMDIGRGRRSRLTEALETLQVFSDAFGVSTYMHGRNGG